MTIKEIVTKLALAEEHIEVLRQDRNDWIIKRYKELYNIDTWHKIKAEFVYSTIAKESGLSTSLVKKVILTNK